MINLIVVAAGAFIAYQYYKPKKLFGNQAGEASTYDQERMEGENGAGPVHEKGHTSSSAYMNDFLNPHAVRTYQHRM